MHQYTVDKQKKDVNPLLIQQDSLKQHLIKGIFIKKQIL